MVEHSHDIKDDVDLLMGRTYIIFVLIVLVILLIVGVSIYLVS